MTLEFLNWVYHAESTPAWHQQPLSDTEREQFEALRENVRDALEKLPEKEQDVIRRIYYEGESLTQIAEAAGCSQSRVKSLLRRASRRLKAQLSGYVQERFNLKFAARSCLICESPERDAIEKLIAEKRPEEPYSVLFRKLKSKFGLRVVSPNTIIGHVKYHEHRPEKE